MTTIGSSPGLAQDEARLRHRSLGRVDEQDHAVDHRKHALHFAAEVGVARRVDDVDLDLGRMDELGREIASSGGVCGLVMDRVSEGVRLVDQIADGSVLRQDRDPALLFQVVRVHDSVFHVLVRADGAGLLQECIDERGFPMVDVGDDGNVADVVSKLRHAARVNLFPFYEFLETLCILTALLTKRIPPACATSSSATAIRTSNG
jgi:hypothetical protein